MDEKKLKRNRVKIIILFIISFAFIMFLPEIRSTIKIRQYEKTQQEQINKNKQEEEKKNKENTLSTIICASEVDTAADYTLLYNKNGLQKYIKITKEQVIEEEQEEKLKTCTEEETEKGITIKCEVNNKTLSKSVEYDFTKMDDNYRKNNIFDFDYKESAEKIKKELENKEYTCG